MTPQVRCIFNSARRGRCWVEIDGMVCAEAVLPAFPMGRRQRASQTSLFGQALADLLPDLAWLTGRVQSNS